MSDVRLIENRTLFELENFSSLDDIKFAVQCDWNGKIFRNVQNLGFLKYVFEVFRKNLNFFKIATGDKFSVKWISNGFFSVNDLFQLNCEVFLQKIREVEKIRKYVEARVIRKNNAFIFSKGTFTKMGRWKYAGGSRPSGWPMYLKIFPSLQSSEVKHWTLTQNLTWSGKDVVKAFWPFNYIFKHNWSKIPQNTVVVDHNWFSKWFSFETTCFILFLERLIKC